MSKYEPLWKWIRDNETDNFRLTYAEGETAERAYFSYDER